MDFITTKHVAEQAKLGEIPALECSLLHHEQGRDAPYNELITTILNGEFNIDSDHCASCLFVDTKCKKCCLAVGDSHLVYKACCNGGWYKVASALNSLEKDYSYANFKAFQEAEAEVCTYIEGVIAKKEAEKVVEPPLQDKKGCSTCQHYDKFKSIPCNKCDCLSQFEPKESKSALRHGDYGLGKNSWGDPKSRIIIRNETYNQYGKVCDSANRKNDIWLGNIFDDLARNAEDLDRFEIRHDGESGKNHWGNVTSHIHSDGDKIWLWVGTNSAYYNFDQITEIAHKLLQEVATAKKWQQPKEKPRKAGSDG